MRNSFKPYTVHRVFSKYHLLSFPTEENQLSNTLVSDESNLFVRSEVQSELLFLLSFLLREQHWPSSWFVFLQICFDRFCLHNQLIFQILMFLFLFVVIIPIKIDSTETTYERNLSH